MLYCASTASVLAITLALACVQQSQAQEVRGPEAPTRTSDAPSPATTPSTPDTGRTQAADQLGDIVVTARRVAENLQNVPVSVTALSGAVLQQQNARQVPDIALTTPGLIVQPTTSSGSSSNFTIRGEVQPEPLATEDPSVGIYVDGYYWARTYGINANLLDIQDVQTLRGPQGTLFGRNTTGGAILINTNDPNFRGLSALASGTYGRFNTWSGTGIVNAPIVDDVLAIRVAYQRNNRDGFSSEQLSGRKLGGQDDSTLRAKLLFKPTSTLSILLSGERFRSNFLNNGFRATYYSPSSPANIEAGVESTHGACFAGGLAACFGAGIAALKTSIANENSGDRQQLNVLPTTIAKTDTYTGTVTQDTDFGAVKFIGGFRRVRALSDIDLDGTQYAILASRLTQNLAQYSGELQITGKAARDRIDFAAGLFAFTEYGTDGSTNTALPALNPAVQSTEGRVRTYSQGIYAQGTFHATDRLSLTGGLRYSIDTKRLLANNGVYSTGTYAGPAAGAVFNCSVNVTGGVCPDTERHGSFGGTSYTASLDYKLTPDILVYAKTARGFRSGGQNLRGTNLFAGSTGGFQPQTSTSYEGGIKSEFFDRRLRVNAAGYYTIDKQVQQPTTIFNTAGASATYITNVGRVNIYGGEFEADAILPAGFRLSGTAAYTHPDYASFIDPNTGFDRSKERFIGVAKWTVSVSPSWQHDFAFGRVIVRGDAAYQSETANGANNFYLNSAGQRIDASTGAVVSAADAAAYNSAEVDQAHVLVNGRVGLTVLDGKLDLSVWGRNLTDRRDRVASLIVQQLGLASVITREPRTFGGTATIKFGGR